MDRKVTDPFKIDGIVCVSVKGYDVETCIKNKETLNILVGDEVMSLSPESLVDKEIMRSKPQPSKHGTAPYILVSYVWNPNLVPND